MAWFAHESFERPNTLSRGDTLDFFQELGEGAKEMLRNQKLNAGEEKEKDGKDNKEKKKEKKDKEDSLKTSKDQITRKKPSNSSSDDAAFSAYVKDLERKEKLELEAASSRKRGETSVSAKELRNTPKIQFSEAEETTPAGAPRVASDDKLQGGKMNKNSRAWNSFGNIGGIDRIRSLRQGKVEVSDKDKEKEKEKEREKAEKEREKAEKAEKEKGDPPPKSPRKEKNHDRAPSWGSSSVNSFTSSGTFKVPAMRSTSDSHVGDLDHSSGGESSGGEKKTPSPRIRIGESFESPTPSPKGGRTKSDRKERDAPPVHKACLAKDSVTVRQLIEDAIKHRKLKQLLFDRDSKGRTPLHVAAETKGCIGILSLILSLASDDLKGKYLQRFLNSADPIGRTALHSAASQGLISHCQLLLRYGADGSVQVEPDKTTVLHHLATCKPIPDNSENEDKVRTLVRLLLESGVDINTKSYPSGETCLHLAARSGNKLVFEILVEFGADVQLLTAANENCIHYAAKAGHPDMIDFLVSIELDATQEGKNGKPESVAKSEEVIQILKRHAESLKYRSGELTLDRPLPPSPTSSQEIRTRKALYKP